MVNKFLITIFLFFGLIFIGYLLFPNFDFPRALPDSLQSKEPGDSESSLRRAYFTNMTREEVMGWYKTQFKWGYRLNYPPEVSSKVIRDQTKSTFLEEIVHPFRESIYINGFEPKDPMDAINIEGFSWRQKIIVRYVPSNILARTLIGIVSLVLVFILMKEYEKYIKTN